MSNITKEQAQEMQDRVERLRKASQFIEDARNTPFELVEKRQNSPRVGSYPKTSATVGAKPNRASGAVMAGPQTPLQKMQALGRMPGRKMNKTEAAYARLLETQKHMGEILWWAFEPINIRLADNTFYKVDFLVLLADMRIEAHETKGHWTDDALVKFKVAANILPFPFKAIRMAKGSFETILEK